ncbi:MAG: hypothetical protein U0M42_03725 [Acutalibacteraceae bacterium]|nr:hypothetical protein [Acutalibacteraceae bacterium]
MKKRGIKKKINFSLNLGDHSKAAVFTLGFIFLYLIAEIVYKVKVQKEVCTWEIILLFLIFSVYELFKKLFAKGEVPKDFNGKPLPLSDKISDRKKRNRYYKKSALIYTVIFGIITGVAFSCSSLLSNVNIGSELFFDNELPNILVSILVAIVFMPVIYIFAYIIEFLWYEYKISLYNELLAIKEEQIQKEREFLLSVQQEAQAIEKSINPTPKRRGRPPKTKTEEVLPENKETAAPAPKRRGRPPKAKEENKEA